MKIVPIDGTWNGDTPPRARAAESEDRYEKDALPGVPDFWAHPVKFT